MDNSSNREEGRKEEVKDGIGMKEEVKDGIGVKEEGIKTIC